MVVERIIFNALASHTAVFLPGIGSLTVSRQAAAMKGREKIISPRYVVNYLTTEAGVSVIELLAAQTGNAADARGQYKDWLLMRRVDPTGAAPLPHNVMIEGVGDIEGGEFVIAPEFDKKLNPGVPAVMKVKPRLRNWHIGLLLVLLIASAAYYHLNYNVDRSAMYARRETRKAMRRDRDRRAQGQTTLQQATLTEMEKGMPRGYSDSIKKAAAKSANLQDHNPAGQSDFQPTDKPASRPATAGSAESASDGHYYVVMGVYSTVENAEKFIAEIGRKDPSIACAVTQLPTGKFMVSGFSSSSREEAESAKTKMIEKYPTAWVYKQN